jgi:hypothetical protein
MTRSTGKAAYLELTRVGGKLSFVSAFTKSVGTITVRSRLMSSHFKRLSFLLVALCAAHVSQAADVFNMPSGQTSVVFASIGDPGNLNDPATGNLYGGVPYT